MKTPFGLLVSLALLGGSALADLAPPPPAPPPAVADPNAVDQPNGMIRDLYTRYFEALTKSDETQAPLPAEFEWAAIADAYFTPELAARFKKALDADEPVIDWDFFISGQDYGDLKIISVETVTIDSAKATVKIVTSNFGTEAATEISLVNGATGWKIADFAFLENGKPSSTLTGILKDSGY